MKIVSRAIVFLTVVFFFAMIAIAFAQVILRNFFASGISWADVTVRHLVLWVGFFGAIIATVQKRHITLDVFSRILPERLKKIVEIVINVLVAVVCGFLAVAAYRFVASSREMGEMLFGGVPAWAAQIVIPVTFCLIGILFLVQIFRKT